MNADLLTDMAVFAAVVEHNSFSIAADQLAMSKSNVSRRVASLEKRLEVKLMHRTTRKLSLTETGRVYFEHCQRLVSEAKNADDAVQTLHSTPSGLLNISMPETLGRAFILPLLPEFLKLYPEIKLSLTITSRKVSLTDERCDVAIRKGEIEDDSLCAVPLGSSTQYFYASPSYLRSAEKLHKVNDLTDHPFLASQLNYGPFDLAVYTGNDSQHVRVNPRLSVKDHEAVLAMTLDGLGISLLPAWMASEYLQSGLLERVLPMTSGPSVDFNLVFQPHRGMAPNLRAFVEFLKERFKLNRPWESAQQPKTVYLASG